jgi:HCOMODA/2-hydroxy-3-carboxy-muconic semialdehyde decarboxylase
LPVPTNLAEAREQLARANRILALEGVLDAFGHVTMRHPTNPGRYLMSRSRGSELIQPEDILEFTLDSEPIVPPTARLYGERVIHGEVFKARPDVMAVCHHHAPSILPFCVSGAELKPVFHLGATMGGMVPFWDSRDEFGNTSLIVKEPAEGASLARALGPHWTVLMRRHGATVAGTTLEELVFRCVYTAHNAGMQIQAKTLGHVSPLTAEEAELASKYNLAPGPVGRAWEYFNVRLDKAEGNFVPPKPARTAAKRSAAKRSAAKKSATKKSVKKPVKMKRSKRRR